MATPDWMTPEALRAVALRQEPADINQSYQDIFGRDVGEAGQEFYGGQDLTQGELNDILMASEEREYFNDLSNTDVDRAFQEMLGRSAGQEGEEFYRDMTYDQIVAAIGNEGPDSEYARYQAGAGAEGYGGNEPNRDLYTESEGGGFGPDDGGDYRGFRNPDTNRLTPDETADARGDLNDQRAGWDALKPWEDSTNPFYDYEGRDFSQYRDPNDAIGGGPGAPSGEVNNDFTWHGINAPTMTNQLQQLQAQRMRYYDNTSPNLGGPALGLDTSRGGLDIPDTPPRGQEYIDPVTGLPIDIAPQEGFEPAPAAGAGAGAGIGGIF